MVRKAVFLDCITLPLEDATCAHAFFSTLVMFPNFEQQTLELVSFGSLVNEKVFALNSISKNRNSLKASFGTNLSEADKEKLLEKINGALAEKFPGYSRVIDDTEFKTTGVKNTTSLGYRYLVQIGFRF